MNFQVEKRYLGNQVEIKKFVTLDEAKQHIINAPDTKGAYCYEVYDISTKQEVYYEIK